MFKLFENFWCELFSQNLKKVIHETHKIYNIFLLALFLEIQQVAIGGILKALNKQTFVLYSFLVTQYVIATPLAYILGVTLNKSL